jgi:ABC-type transport system substrate-binding protein
MSFRNWAWATSLCLAFAAQPCGAQSPSPVQSPATVEKVFRYAFPVAETGFDPAQLSDLYSRTLSANIFDTLYTYDYLARPMKVRPALAAGMPEVSSDFRTYTVHMRHGILFADDPAFNGKPREVTAYDVVYSIQRQLDPANKSPNLSGLLEEKIVGAAAANKRAEATGRFDYTREIEGLRALDRYTVQFRLEEPRPRFVYLIADPSVMGTVAREVVEKYGAAIMEHPVGTGPFMLQEWRRASQIVLVRNPRYREEYYTAEPPAGDTVSQAIYARLKGKRLPLVDRVVVSIIEEPQPRWLAFLNNEHDFLERLPYAYAPQVLPNNHLNGDLTRRGMQLERVPMSDVTLAYFNMEDPVVGGYSPQQVALRRAINLAYDAAAEVRGPRRGQALIAQGPVVPATTGYDPDLRTENGVYDPARAMALLDLFGYRDRDGDGWRERPDGSPLAIDYYSLSSADYRELDEIFKKNMDAIGIKVVLRIGKWPDHLKNARAGKLQMWALGSAADSPDAAGALERGYSKSWGQQNLARFRNDRYDELFRRQGEMPDGPARDAVTSEMVRILTAYAPYRWRTHRIALDISQPWVVGYRRPAFALDWWRYVDIDTSKLPH